MAPEILYDPGTCTRQTELLAFSRTCSVLSCHWAPFTASLRVSPECDFYLEAWLPPQVGWGIRSDATSSVFMPVPALTSVFRVASFLTMDPLGFESPEGGG